MAWQDYINTVQKVYIAYYQRPGDPAGIRYWAQMLDVKGGDLTAIIDAFANSAESQALYGPINQTTIGTVIDSMYQALFGRAPDPAGKQWYINEFTAGRMTAGQIALAILNGARNDDLVTIQNKLQVANTFSQLVDGDALTSQDFGVGPFQATYGGDADAQQARNMLKAVLSNPSTLLTEQQVRTFIQQHIADSGDPISQVTTLSLTTGVDNIVLTETQKEVVGIVDTNNSISTLNAGDVITGTGVTGDKLRVILNATDYPGSATITNVDTIEVQVGSAAAVNFNATGVSGAKEIIMVNAVGNQTISNIGSLDTAVGIRNTTQSLTADWANSLLTGPSNAVTVMLDTATGGTAQNVTISQGVEIVNLKTSGGASSINTITDGAGGVLGTLNIEAAANVRIDLLDAGITKVDASKSTANVNIGFNPGQNVTFIGGKGNDTVRFLAGDFNANDNVSGGDGTDTLSISLTGPLATKNQISGFEIISLNSNVAATLNLDGNTDVNTIVVRADGTADTVTLTNVANVLQKVVYLGDLTSSAQTFDNLTVNLAPGKGTGTSDATVVEVTNWGVALGTGNAFNLGTLTLPSVEDVTIKVLDKGNTNLTLADTALTSLTLSSSKDITFNATLNSTGLKTVNASGVSGTLTIDTSNSNESVYVTAGNKINITVGDGNGADDITTIALSGNGGNQIIEQSTSIANGFFIAQNFVAGVGGDVIQFYGTAQTSYYQEVAANVAASTGSNGVIVVTDDNAMPVTGNDEATLVSNFIAWAGGSGVTFDNSGFSAAGANVNTVVVVEGNDANVYLFRVTGVDATAGITAGDTVELIGILTGTKADASDLYQGNFI
ncbi:MAG: hypothetical protein QXM93_03660 [Candidatus Methanomethyliaceae archaeon]